jgi:hypothetical protein
MIHAIAMQYDIQIKSNNVIDLGYENGWSNRIVEFYKSIQMYMIPNTSTKRVLGSCDNEYSAEYHDDISGEVFTVISRVDSGD